MKQMGQVRPTSCKSLALKQQEADHIKSQVFKWQLLNPFLFQNTAFYLNFQGNSNVNKFANHSPNIFKELNEFQPEASTLGSTGLQDTASHPPVRHAPTLFFCSFLFSLLFKMFFIQQLAITTMNMIDLLSSGNQETGCQLKPGPHCTITPLIPEGGGVWGHIGSSGGLAERGPIPISSGNLDARSKLQLL